MDYPIKELVKKIIPQPFLSLYHFILAFLGALIYGFPSRKLKVVGVTGTNGKTTTTEMITKILEEAGKNVALANSIRFKIGKEEIKNTLRMTMPGRFFLQRFLKKAIKSNCQYAVLEVTSEGIKQYRHLFINFEIAVFTNLAPEHIESHRSFENYREAKRKLFKATKKIHILNFDDENFQHFSQFLAKEKFFYGLKNNPSALAQNEKLILAREIKEEGGKLAFFVEDEKFILNLIGGFNIYNALAAISLALSQGISLGVCKRALENFSGVPGRMEEVISKPFKVVVDYAFTPFALEKVYQTIKKQFIQSQNQRLICVLGACGGGRDKWKRPVLGEIASKYCQEIILTNEDPYDEDPMEIIEQIAKGVGKRAKKILDRKEAIREALKLAKEKDVIVITGKGCEPSICLAKGKKIPWDDRKVVKEEYENFYVKKI